MVGLETWAQSWKANYGRKGGRVEMSLDMKRTKSKGVRSLSSEIARESKGSKALGRWDY